MRKIGVLAVAFVAFTFMIVGCGTVGKDIEAIKELILADDVWFDAGTPEDTTINEPSSSFFTAESLFWWRGPQTKADPEIDVQVDGDSAWAKWTRNHTAILNIFAFESDTGWMHWTKDISEYSEIRATFKNTGVDNEFDGWELDKISCAIGNSNNSTVSLDSFHVTSARTGQDFWVTDPLNSYYDVADLIAFGSWEEVTVTLYTSGDEAIAFVHTIVGLWPVRDTFSMIEPGIHQGTWVVQLFEGPRFAIFDVMAKNTLYEQEDAYQYSGILLPYQIKN